VHLPFTTSTRFTNPIDEEMRNMVAIKRYIVSFAALTACVGLSGVGAADGKRQITVPAADLKWEALVPGSPVKMSVLWGDYKKGPFGMLLTTHRDAIGRRFTELESERMTTSTSWSGLVRSVVVSLLAEVNCCARVQG
jgi:hypothetical protein